MSKKCLNCLEMSKVENLIVEFFNSADAVQVDEGTWYYSESSINTELLELYTQLAKANEDYKALFSAFESCQDELKKANERVRELDEIADTAFKYNHSSAQCLRAWNKLQQLRKEQENV